MRYCCFKKDGIRYIGNYGLNIVSEIKENKFHNDFFPEFKVYKGEPLVIDDIKIESPLPRNRIVYGIADNFKIDTFPIVFFKGLSNESVIMKENFDLIINSDIDNLWAEAELGFVISKDVNYKTKKDIDESYIFGYFLANDITVFLT